MISKTNSFYKLIKIIFMSNIISNNTQSSQLENSKIIEKTKILFEENMCFKKGGLGVLTKGMYVVLDSEYNELILKNSKKWIGKTRSQKEVVILYNENVYAQQESLPDDYFLSDSLIVSFEIRRVYFFNFKTFSGGFYLR